MYRGKFFARRSLLVKNYENVSFQKDVENLPFVNRVTDEKIKVYQQTVSSRCLFERIHSRNFLLEANALRKTFHDT